MKPLNTTIEHWEGKRVWIIGASSGIGKALANTLRSEGALLALSARRDIASNQKPDMNELNLPLDVRDETSLRSTYHQLREKWDHLDLVIYCAGIYTPMRAWEIDLDIINDSIATNLQGVYNMLSMIVPDMVRQRKGGICLVSSVAGYTGLPKAFSYGPGKAALINLAQILYSDLSPKGISVYLVNPGFVATRLTQQNDFKMPALITSDDAAKEIVKGLSEGRFEIHFPRRFTYCLKWLSRLPDRLRFYLIKRVVQ